MNIQQIRSLHRDLEQAVRKNPDYANFRARKIRKGTSSDLIDGVEYSTTAVMLVDTSYRSSYLEQCARMAEDRGRISAREKSAIISLAPHLQSGDTAALQAALSDIPSALRKGRLGAVVKAAEDVVADAAQKSDSDADEDVVDAFKSWIIVGCAALGAIWGGGPGAVVGVAVGKAVGETTEAAGSAIGDAIYGDEGTGFMPRPDGSDCVTPEGLSR